MEYDASGQLVNASFMDFLMPYASEVPSIEIDHLQTPSPLNPLGVKGAGEAGVIPGSAAIASAIEDAEGFPITTMPISPSELFAAAPVGSDPRALKAPTNASARDGGSFQRVGGSPPDDRSASVPRKHTPEGSAR